MVIRKSQISYDLVGYPEEGPQRGWGLEGNRIHVEDIFYKRFSRGGLPQHFVEYEFYSCARSPWHQSPRTPVCLGLRAFL